MVNSDDPAFGVLIDLDFAARDRDPDTGHRVVLPSVPGGTLPFRAIDLCAGDPLPRSLYRHDLESFFWTLLWILLYKSVHSTDKVIAAWSAGPWDDIWTYKLGFLMRPLGRGLAEDIPLRKAWIIPLWKVLRDGYGAIPVESISTPSVHSQEATDFDDETLGNRITYDGFMKILKPNHWLSFST